MRLRSLLKWVIGVDIAIMSVAGLVALGVERFLPRIAWSPTYEIAMSVFATLAWAVVLLAGILLAYLKLLGEPRKLSTLSVLGMGIFVFLAQTVFSVSFIAYGIFGATPSSFEAVLTSVDFTMRGALFDFVESFNLTISPFRPAQNLFWYQTFEFICRSFWATWSAVLVFVLVQRRFQAWNVRISEDTESAAARA